MSVILSLWRESQESRTASDGYTVTLQLADGTVLNGATYPVKNDAVRFTIHRIVAAPPHHALRTLTLPADIHIAVGSIVLGWLDED